VESERKKKNGPGSSRDGRHYLVKSPGPFRLPGRSKVDGEQVHKSLITRGKGVIKRERKRLRTFLYRRKNLKGGRRKKTHLRDLRILGSHETKKNFG